MNISVDDFIDLGLDVQTESDVIDYEEDEDEDENEIGIGINKTFCLQNVDDDEVLCYVDKINNDIKPSCNCNNNEDIEQMKKTIEKLEEDKWAIIDNK